MVLHNIWIWCKVYTYTCSAFINVWHITLIVKTKAMCIINRTDKLIRIQHEKKHGKGSKNISTYFDNKMIEEEEMEKQVNDGTFDECAYVKDDDDGRL